MESILLVEDEPLVLVAQTEALTENGFLVHPVATAEAALAVAGTIGVSAAIIDMGLPDCSGDHLARQLRAKNKLLPILICTGYDTAALAEATADIGVRLIEKPIDERTLIAVLREHMQTARKASLPSLT